MLYAFVQQERNKKDNDQLNVTYFVSGFTEDNGVKVRSSYSLLFFFFSFVLQTTSIFIEDKLAMLFWRSTMILQLFLLLLFLF